MPWIAPSHQAPVLFLKAWRPALFSGLGLVLGTMAPDLAAVLLFDNNSALAHTFAGQLTITLPMVVLLHALATRLVFPWLMPRLCEVGQGLNLVKALSSRPARTTAEWARVAYSGVLGGITHVFIDGFTHGNHNGWALQPFPLLSERVSVPFGGMPLHDVLQWVLTLVLGVATLGLWQRMAAGDRRAPRAAVPVRTWGSVRFMAALLAAMVAGAVCALLLRPDGDLALCAERAVYGALAGPVYASLLAAALDRLREVVWRPSVAAVGPDRVEGQA